ncbi:MULTISPECIES: hypothetical protein [Bacillaceae]|jgi:hypothetical protein|uniref:hypothetical protein n=1 Tax=Bacillaceae TaxID=186817 RepID=UPI00047E3535|nr:MULTISPECIES: hypothetical protein [Bacillaceae]QJX60749.1 hypothetical protein HLK66_03175 [Niallia circulans]HWK23357.1 hypothetical protein [Ureibacillus sp.]
MKSEITEAAEKLLRGFKEIVEIRDVSKHIAIPPITLTGINEAIEAIEEFLYNNNPQENDWEGFDTLLSKLVVRHAGEINVPDEFSVSPEIKKSLKGKSGEHFVAGELFRRNTIVALPPQNTPLFDLIVTSPNGMKTCMVQVKTSFYDNTYGVVWELNENFTRHTSRDDLFVVLVDARKQPEYFVFAYNDLVDLVNKILELTSMKSKRTGSRIFISYADTFELSIAEVFYSKKSLDWDVLLNYLK